YGHTRPLCALAGRLAAEPGVVITMLLAPNWLEQVDADIAAQFPSGHEALGRIRIVSLFDSTEKNIFALMPTTAVHYPTAYEALFRGEAIKCASRGTMFAPVPPPAIVIVDLFGSHQLRATRNISGTKIPIFTFIAGNAGSLLRMWGPKSLGGRGIFSPEIDAEALRTGKTADEIGEQILNYTDGTVIQIPGVPAMYDYESFPQRDDGVRGCTLRNRTSIRRESLVAFETWMKQTLHKPVYAVGPLLPPGYGVGQMLSSSAPRDVEIITFLNSMGSKYGDKSVLFISFGTVFWPKVEGQLEELIDALIEKEFPFILCHASPMATVSEVSLKKIEASGIGMASTWAPQQSILTHSATGWFLTHGGHGGITESLASGVPMICWPFEADQPIAAAHLSENLNVAFHLIEVRSAKGLQPLRSGRVPVGSTEALRAEFREIIDQCRGEPGTEKRDNAQRMQDALAEAASETGSSRVAIRAFLAEYVA
ncbi:UDP-Glycosyltransferase/glycogen phosphorylase, partial [Mycena latifolia]